MKVTKKSTITLEMSHEEYAVLVKLLGNLSYQQELDYGELTIHEANIALEIYRDLKCPVEE